jgi:L-xylulokinase
MEAYGLGDCMDLLPPLIESADIAGTVTQEVASGKPGLLPARPWSAGCSMSLPRRSARA